jgi:hypothetical protein
VFDRETKSDENNGSGDESIDPGTSEDYRVGGQAMPIFVWVLWMWM